MDRLTVAKFGSSAIGADGLYIPDIIKRIIDLKQDSKMVCVFSAPLTDFEGVRSVTDVVLDLGRKAQSGQDFDLDSVNNTYEKILAMINSGHRDECKKIIKDYLGIAQESLARAAKRHEFADEIRSNALAFSGELLMSNIMDLVLKSNNIRSAAVPFDSWPIITDANIESTNFLYSESAKRTETLEALLKENDVVTIGGFIGKTTDGTTTTYERGGSDRTAADLGILLHKKYDVMVDFEKDSSVVSADPKIVTEELDEVFQLSYNEARLAGMFGMKILDPIAIKEILENGVDIPITISNMKKPKYSTTIKRAPDSQNDYPLKIVTGRKNCAIFRIESDSASGLLTSLENDKRYSEFIILSPFTKDGTEFTRILFLDGDYVKRNEKYLRGFDPLATITYNRGVITLIGDEMWRVQQVASKTSARLGEAGLNILNMDAQEETSRIIIVIEDSDNNIKDAIKAVHAERARINFA